MTKHHCIECMTGFAHAFKKDLWIVSLDLSKAFEKVFHECVIEAIMEQGVDEAHACLLQELYWEQTGQVGADAFFELFRGVRQGFGAQNGPQTERTQAKNARGGAHQPAQADSYRFRTGFLVFRPRSKTFELRDSSAEPNSEAPNPCSSEFGPLEDQNHATRPARTLTTSIYTFLAATT